MRSRVEMVYIYSYYYVRLINNVPCYSKSTLLIDLFIF